MRYEAHRLKSFIFMPRATPVQQSVLARWGIRLLTGNSDDPEAVLAEFLQELRGRARPAVLGLINHFGSGSDRNLLRRSRSKEARSPLLPPTRLVESRPARADQALGVKGHMRGAGQVWTSISSLAESHTPIALPQRPTGRVRPLGGCNVLNRRGKASPCA